MACALRKGAARALLLKLQKEVKTDQLGGWAVRKELLRQRTLEGQAAILMGRSKKGALSYEEIEIRE